MCSSALPCSLGRVCPLALSSANSAICRWLPGTHRSLQPHHRAQMHPGSSQLTFKGKLNLLGKSSASAPCKDLLRPRLSLPSQEITANHVSEIGRSPAWILTFPRGTGTPLAAGFESHGHTGTSSEMFPACVFIPSTHQGEPSVPQRCVTSTLSWEEIRTRLAQALVPGCTVVIRGAGVPSPALGLQSL